jgi:hypothetical protein
VHKSYIVQVVQLTKLEKESVFVGTPEIPVGAMYKLLLEKRLRGL